MSSGKQKSESESYKKKKKIIIYDLDNEGSPEAKNVEYSKSFE